MATIYTIETKPLRPLFLSYLFPALIGMLLMSVNILVDGIFVSNGIGPTALAAVNIAVPVFSILLSISLWIGVGGATLYSIELGKNNIEKAQRIFTLSFLTMVVIVVAIISALLIDVEAVAYLFGANEDTIPYVKDYLFIILLFGIVYTFENLLSIFIRNDGNPNLAMAGLITTSVVNIILNYLFIFTFDFGMTGVALATVISTIIGTMVLCTHFFLKKSKLTFKTKFFNQRDTLKILSIGFPSFIVEGSVAIMIVLYNITFLHYLSTDGVTAYAMINYIHTVLIVLFMGIGMALQPLVSYHYGAKLTERILGLLRIGIITALIIGGITTILAIAFPAAIISVFGDTTEVVRGLAVNGFAYFAIGYVFLAINMVLAEFFQSIEKIRLATIIILLRSIVLFVPLLFILPMFFGATVIWWVFPITEGMTTMLIVGFLWRNKRIVTGETKHVCVDSGKLEDVG